MAKAVPIRDAKHHESVRGRLRTVLPDMPWSAFVAASVAAAADAEDEAPFDDHK